MPAQDYETSDIQYPGQFKCSEIALVSLTGKIAGIKSATLELNIYESLFRVDMNKGNHTSKTSSQCLSIALSKKQRNRIIRKK